MSEWIVEIVDGMPHIKKMIPLVRCKDCNRKNVLPDVYGIGTEALYCHAIEHYVEHDFFCKYGEKVTE